MFSPGSLDKNSSNASENCSPSRGKFGVGINPLGDESQQNIRIQLAVRRYNNSTSNSFFRPASERNFSVSAFKNAFLKNSQKYENIENDKEESAGGAKKSFNQYQGVGNFPVVHLKKNALISKPVKRPPGNATKVQLPELPFNRYLSSSPDVSLDTKTSTRSVLDVLQDLSRKRIHTKDDNVMSKRKCKGLGGDAPLDIEAPYKPLFVHKNKSNAVVTRDSTTQTQETSALDTSRLKKVETVLSTEPEDPRAELRRKLARQNNEIFASLSSSTLSYPCRKNSEKLTKLLDSMQQNGRMSKKVKLSVDACGDKNGDGGSFKSNDSINGGSVTTESFNKMEKKQKKAETSKISPNKDRLTSIYLEMKNVSPKVQARSSCGGESSEKDDIGLSPRASLSLAAAEDASKVKAGDGKVSDSQKGLGGSAGDGSKSAAGVQIAAQVESKMPGQEKTAPAPPPAFNIAAETGGKTGEATPTTSTENASSIFATCASSNTGTSTTTTTTTTAAATTFKMPLVSTVSSSLPQKPIFSIGVPSKDANVESKVGLNDASKPYARDGISCERKSFGSPPKDDIPSSPPKSDFFKFGAGDANFAKSPAAASEPKAASNEETPAKEPSPPATTGPSAGTKTAVENVQPPPSLFATSAAGAAPSPVASAPLQTTQPPPFIFSDKAPTADNKAFPFTFGNSSFAAGSKFPQFGKPEDKPKTDESTTKNEAGASQEKPVSAAVTTVASSGIGAATTVAAPAVPAFVNAATTAQNTFPGSSFPAAPSFGQSTFQASAQNVTFKFGEKSEGEAGSSNLFGFQKSKSGVFTFGQKDGAGNNAEGQSVVQPQGNMFQSNLFTFGQKSSTPASTQATATPFGQTPAATTQATVTPFGQTPAATTQATATPFGQTPAATTQATATPFGQTPAATTQATATPFGQTPAATTQATVTPFGQTPPTSTQATATPFGQTPPAQSSLFQQGGSGSATFGSAPQTSGAQNITPVPSFAQTSASAANVPLNNTFAAGNKMNVPTFGQATSTFGQGATFPNQGNNIFGGGASQSAPVFGASSSTPFAQAFGQGSNFFMQSPTQGTGQAFNSGSSFPAGTFGQTQDNNNVFGQKPGGFEQPAFGQSSTAPAFGAQAPFAFGATTTAAASGFPAMNPATTASVFTFGSAPKSTASTTSSFSFSTATQPNSSAQSVFTFSGQSDNNFKFGASTSNAAAKPFGFDAGATPGTSDVAAKPPPSVFNFGASQTTSSNAGFNFGATPSPSVFSFGGSGSASNSNSKFTFGATPSPNMGMFQPGGATPSPSTSVPLQGIFNIGSGSTQPRNRIAATRARRRT